MSLRHLIISRALSTTRSLARPALSSNYKSKQLWDERFNCGILTDGSLIKSINTKILGGKELSNLEVDIFINIAAPKEDEIAQLQESAKMLKKFRRTLHAHTLLPSTAHATCRLFLDSKRLPSLVNIFEQPVDYGIFPDQFSLNLSFDEALESENYALAPRLAVFIMLQEEFGINPISDNFALHSVAKYIESMTDFNDWNPLDISNDPIFNEEKDPTDLASAKKDDAKKKADEEEGDEEEEEAECVRIPFLRNPYFDNHFDIKNPRALCGKTLAMLGHHLVEQNQPDLGIKCQLLGNILWGNWSEVKKSIDDCLKMPKVGQVKKLSQFYIDNLHEVEAPSEDLKNSLLTGLGNLNDDEDQLISQQAEQRFANSQSHEEHDIRQLQADLVEWSRMRLVIKEAEENSIAKKKLIEEIMAKKEELRVREQYLYFYDNLKKSNLTRMEYD